MAVGPVGFSIEQQDLLWGMWRGGESLRTMGRSLGVSMPRIQRFLRLTGGVRPGPQRRREGHLGAGEREEISRGIAAGLSGRVIAGRLGRSPSSVSREIDGNGGRGAYRALRPKPSKLATNPALRERVAALRSRTGRRSRSRRGFTGSTRMCRRCGCRTRRSTATCTCRHGRCSTRACFTGCAVSVRSAARAARCLPTGAGASGTWFPSTPARWRPTTVRSPGTGREISCLGPRSLSTSVGQLI